MNYDPLVVPPHQALCLFESAGRWRALASEVVNDPVMKLEESQVKLRDDEVYIVTWITNKRSPLAIPGEIIQVANECRLCPGEICLNHRDHKGTDHRQVLTRRDIQGRAEVRGSCAAR